MDQNEAPKLDQSEEVPPTEAERQQVAQPEVNQETTSESMSSDSQEPSESSDSLKPQEFTADNNAASTEAQNSVTSGEEATPPVVNPMSNDAVSSSTVSKKPGLSHLWRRVAIIAAVILVLAGGSAAAFYTVYLPHQPWYILDTALKNSMAQNDFTLNANANVTTSSMAYKINSITAANLTAKGLDENLTVTLAGASIPLEIRIVNSNLYFKFGDLSSVASLASLAGGALKDPNLGPVIGPLLSKLSNQWVVVDSTLLDQSKSLKCMLNSSWTLSNSDSNYMVNSYLNQPFFTVNSQTADTLNSQAEYKMNVTMSQNLAQKYLAGLSNLNAFKSYAQCTGAKPSTSHATAVDNQTTPLTIWVNKSTNRIDKIETVGTAQAAKNGTSGTLDATISYANVNVQAPAQAIPVTQLIAQLMQGLQSDPQLLNSISPMLSGL